jgi:Glycolipid 2-alpha-mannosyltransferase
MATNAMFIGTMPAKAAIVCLTQNTPTRVSFLRGSLTRLFEAFNARAGYPVLILHEGDFTAHEQDDLRRMLGGARGDALQFIELEPDDFVAPDWVSEKVVRAHQRVVPDAPGVQYRTMTRWWLRDLPKYISEYDVYMRLDDDAYLDEEIGDPIASVLESGVDYASNCVHIEHPMNALGLADLCRRLIGESARLSGLFVTGEHGPEYSALWSFVAGLPSHLKSLVSTERLEAPIMYYNNFHIARRCVWESKPLRDFYSGIDESGGQYWLRWGDAPIQTIGIVALGFTIGRLEFRYSKRHERADGAFVNCNHELASPFMDASVDVSAPKAGSLTEFTAFNRMLQRRGIADIGRKIGKHDAKGWTDG